MIFEFHPLASLELDESVQYYEEKSIGLGLELLDEVYIAIERIILFPESGVKTSKLCRKCLIHRFPFGIIYRIKDNKIKIIAIMQLNRNPEYWKDRI